VDHGAGRREKNPCLCRYSNFSHQPILQSHLAPTNAYICTLITTAHPGHVTARVTRKTVSIIVPQRAGNLVCRVITAHVRSGSVLGTPLGRRRSRPHAQEVRGVSYEKGKC
jgi:hypothetical protein